MSAEALDSLRERVLGDPELAQRLAALDDDAVCDEAIAAARALGLDVTRVDVAAAQADASREWLQRWIR